MAAPASHRRRRSWWPLLFVAILSAHSLVIYLFTRGFLLTRTELDLHSSRDDRPRDVSPGCASWPPPAVDRLVHVVLDALRFDFVAPSTFFQEKQPWMDKLQVLQKLAANEKTSSRIIKALADPPTTSLQHLKHGKEVCISTLQQLNFAVTISALLGIPFPFGSIGRVNPDLYALSAGNWDNQRMGTNACTLQNDVEAWMRRYAEVLCVKCWQVKRYINRYSSTSVIGFPSEDLQHVADLYSSETGSQEEFEEGKGSRLQWQIDAYIDFLQSFAKRARSAWTEFNLWLMGLGLLLMILSVIPQACALKLNTICQPSDRESASSRVIPKFSFAFILVAFEQLVSYRTAIYWQKVELQSFFWPQVASPLCGTQPRKGVST